jgi:hypothetical protein
VNWAQLKRKQLAERQEWAREQLSQADGIVRLAAERAGLGRTEFYRLLAFDRTELIARARARFESRVPIKRNRASCVNPCRAASS